MDQNSIIVIALAGIVLGFLVGGIIGHSLGIREGLERGARRITNRFLRYTVATKRRAPDGSVYTLN